MSDDPSRNSNVPPVLSEEEAALVWHRAAQLQADALHRLDAVRDLGEAEASGGADTPEAEAEAAAGVRPGYAVEHVVEAAKEAGISARYVAMAMAELAGSEGRSAPARPGVDPVLGITEREATLFLGTQERSLAVSVVLPASPDSTLRAVGSVLRAAPYELRLRDTVGGPPLEGGVLVFDLPGPIVGAGGSPAGAFNRYWMGVHQQLEARQVHVTLRALHGSGPPRTELTMTCDVRPGIRRNVRASQILSGVLGGSTGVLTGALLAKGAAVVLSAAVLGPAAAVGMATTAAGLLGYRKLYPSALKQARGEMTGALEAVASSARSETVFGGDAPGG